MMGMSRDMLQAHIQSKNSNGYISMQHTIITRFMWGKQGHMAHADSHMASVWKPNKKMIEASDNQLYQH